MPLTKPRTSRLPISGNGDLHIPRFRRLQSAPFPMRTRARPSLRVRRFTQRLNPLGVSNVFRSSRGGGCHGCAHRLRAYAGPGPVLTASGQAVTDVTGVSPFAPRARARNADKGVSCHIRHTGGVVGSIPTAPTIKTAEIRHFGGASRGPSRGLADTRDVNMTGKLGEAGGKCSSRVPVSR